MTTVHPHKRTILEPDGPGRETGGADCREAIRQACLGTAAQHERLCPRQVLGVRMGLAGAEALGLALPAAAKRLVVFAETDGCFVDGIVAATGCSVGHRTLRVIDYGRVALTAVDAKTGQAVRVAPRMGVRARARDYAPGETRRYYAQLLGYERMPAAELLRVESVTLALDLPALIGERGVRVDCSRCGEEVLNRRELTVGGRPVCPACAGTAYYASTGRCAPGDRAEA